MKIRNSNQNKKGLIGTGFHAVAALALVFTFDTFAQGETRGKNSIVVDGQGTIVAFAGGNAKSGGYMKVRIDGPDGTNVFEGSSEFGMVEWDIQSELADGYYSYDVWFRPAGAQVIDDEITDGNGDAAPKAAGQNGDLGGYQSGILKLQGGFFLEEVDSGPSSDSLRELSANRPESLSLGNRLVGHVLNLLVPNAHAGVTHGTTSVTIDGQNPSVFLNDTDASGGQQVWIFENNATSLRFFDLTCLFSCGPSDNPIPFVVQDDGVDNAFFIESTGDIGLGTSTPIETLDIVDTDTPGIRLDDTVEGVWTMQENSNNLRFMYGGTASLGDVFTLDDDGDVGINTTSPSQTLHIISEGLGGGIRLQENSGGGTIWDLYVDGFAGITFQDEQTGNGVMRLRKGAPSESLVVTANGAIGMGTASPDAPLHILRSNNAASILVEDTAAAASQVMFQLRDAGGPRFRMENSDAGYSWNFNAFPAGFSIGLTGSGGSEFTLGPDGSLIVGPGGTNNFQVQANGTVRVQGAIVHSSSRSTKESITPVDGDVILEKLRALDIPEWSYKRASSDRHVSPMAEDFYAAFGLGTDETTVSPSDLAGIALAAAKALRSENDRLRAEIEDLKQLKSEVSQIRAALESAR